jgi:hypothetical protein
MFTLSVRRRRRLAIAVAALLAVPALALATIGSQPTLGGLTKASSDVIRGKVVARQSRWNDSKTLIVTDVVLQVSEAFKGATAGQVTLEVVGGRVDDLVLDVVGGPSFAVGEDVLVFASRGPGGRLRLPGLAQAKFTLETAADGKVWIRNPVSLDRFLPGEAQTLDARGRLEWSEFRGRLAGILERHRQGGVQ